MDVDLKWHSKLQDGTIYHVILYIDTIDTNISIFAPFVMDAINEVLIRDDITLYEPTDLLRVFEKGAEEPDVIFKYNNIRYSMNKFFNSIPDETKDLILSPDMPIETSEIYFRQEFIDSNVDRLMTHIIDKYTYNDVPSSVRFSLAKFTLLMYIDSCSKLEGSDLYNIAEDIHEGRDPKSYTRMGNHAEYRLEEQEGEYTFSINRNIITSILNLYRVVDVDQIYIDYVEGLPYRIIDSIGDYTRTNFRDVNTFLRKGRLYGSPDDEWLDKVKKDIENIDEAFIDAPPLQEPLTLYRGQKRERIDAKSYTSTTTDVSAILTDDFLDLRNRNACCLYVITAVPGSKILPIMTISHVQFEEEVLLDRNGKYFITKLDQKEYGVKDASYRSPKYETRTIKTIYITYMPGDSQMIPPPTVYTNSDEEDSEEDL